MQQPKAKTVFWVSQESHLITALAQLVDILGMFLIKKVSFGIHHVNSLVSRPEALLNSDHEKESYEGNHGNNLI